MENQNQAFPAQAYLRDFRAAGGRSGIHAGAVFYLYGGPTCAPDDVDFSYLAAKRADPDHRAKIRAALEAEIIAMSPTELAVLHAY